VFDTQNNSMIYVNGLPGSGKSTFLSDFILDIAENYSPDEVRFVITVFDDKGEEDFGKIAELPHVSACYLNGATAMFSVILDAVRHEAKVRDEIISGRLGSGNNLGVYREKCTANNGWKKIPYLFWIVDEASLLGRMDAKKKKDFECIVKLARSRGIFFLFGNQNKENQVDGVMASLCDLLSYNLRLEQEDNIYRRVLKHMNTASAIGDGDKLDEIVGGMRQPEVADARNRRVGAVIEKWKKFPPGLRTWLKTSLPTKDDVPDAGDRFKGVMVSSPKDTLRIVAGMTLSKVEDGRVVKTYKDACFFDFNAALGRNLVYIDNGKVTRSAFLASAAASLKLERQRGKCFKIRTIDLDERYEVGTAFESLGACAAYKGHAVALLKKWECSPDDVNCFNLLIVNCTALKDKINEDGEAFALTDFVNILRNRTYDGAKGGRFVLLVGRESIDFYGMESLFAVSMAFSLARISPGSLEYPFSCFRKSNDEGGELKFGGRLYETFSRGAIFESFIPFDLSVTAGICKMIRDNKHSAMALPSGAVPFYLVIDTSASMHGREQEVREMILEIIRQVKSNRRIGEIAYLGIVTFNSSPRQLLPMTALSAISENIADNLVMENGTMMGAALSYVTQLAQMEIPEEITEEGFAPQKPFVFILTDGYSNDKEEMCRGLREFNSYRWRNRLVIGFGEADETELEEIAYISKSRHRHWVLMRDFDASTIARVIISAIMG
jgi:uncharacterized protein YegL